MIQGAYSGILVGFCVSMWLAVGSTLYPPSGKTMGVLPSYADQCEPSNITVKSSPSLDQHSISTLLHPDDQGGLHNLYAMSYLYFGAMATSSVVLVGLIVSYATGPTKRNHIKEGLLWWDLSKKQVEVPSVRRGDNLADKQLVPLRNLHKDDGNKKEETTDDENMTSPLRV